MKISGIVANVEGFRQAYNTFMQGLIAEYKDAGDYSTCGELNVLVIHAIPFDNAASGVWVQLRVMEDGSGEFILDCRDARFQKAFAEFWQDYQRRIVGAPSLPDYAKQEQWDAWFNWYYHQAWGPVSDRVEHITGEMAKRGIIKSRSTIEKRHADYMTNRRDKLQ